MKETEFLLCLLVRGHLVLVLATLLGEGTCSVVNPFVTIDLGLLCRGAIGWRGSSNDCIDARLAYVPRQQSNE